MSAQWCGPLAAWFNAWLVGSVSIDEVVDAAGGGTLDDGSPLAAALVELRGDGVVRAVFPVAGDVRGLPGPAEFRAVALDRGEAVVGASLALTHDGPAYLTSRPPTWTLQRVEPAAPDPVFVTQAQHELTEAVRESAGALAAAQVAGSSGPAPDLEAVRRAGAPNLPRGYPSRAVALIAQAERLRAVLDLALLDPVGGAVDRTGIAARTDALRPLVTAARRARTAGYNALTEPG